MYSYVVVEIQTANDGSVASLIYTFADSTKTEAENKAAAESKYHTVLSYAALSGLKCHSAVLLRNDGAIVNKQAYTNDAV